MPPEPSLSMLIDRVDDGDHVIGTIRRDDVFRVHANFRVAHVFLFSAPDLLVLQQLALTRDRNPGRWGSSVAAYLFAGETYEVAAHRRLWEELQVEGISLRIIGKTVMNDEGCKKYITLFTGMYDETLHPDPAHIADVRSTWLSDVVRTTIERPDQFTPTFLHVLEYFRSQRTH